MKYSGWYQSYRADTIFIRKISKGHNSIKMYVECRFLFSAHCLIMVYICTKFHENILNGIRVMERTGKVNRRTSGQMDIQTDRRRAPHKRTPLRWAYEKLSYLEKNLPCSVRCISNRIWTQITPFCISSA